MVRVELRRSRARAEFADRLLRTARTIVAALAQDGEATNLNRLLTRAADALGSLQWIEAYRDTERLTHDADV